MQEGVNATVSSNPTPVIQYHTTIIAMLQA